MNLGPCYDVVSAFFVSVFADSPDELPPSLLDESEDVLMADDDFRLSVE